MSDFTIPDVAVEAACAAMWGDDFWPDALPVTQSLQPPDPDAERRWTRAGLTAALPHLLTDEMVERAVGGYREVAGRCSRQATRAALEAALGGAT